MTTFHWRAVAAFGAIAVVFVGLLVYAGSVAPQMGRDSNRVVEAFYARCQARDYAGARAYLSESGKEGTGGAAFEKLWRKFEAKHGPLAKWEAANKVSIAGFGGSVCVFPPFVDFRHAVTGSKSTGTLIYIRVVPENGKWKIERFTVLR